MPEKRIPLNFFQKHHPTLHIGWPGIFHSKKASELRTLDSIDREILTRVKALEVVLEDLKPSINAINILIQIHRESGKYCESCTYEKRKPGSCGSSCALLRPKGDDKGITSQIRVDWVQRATQTKGEYNRIAYEMRKSNKNPQADAISRWELDLGDLHRALFDRPDKEAADRYMEKDIKETEGLDLDWTFEKAWREKEAEIELAPNEL
ncbi:hypothetical protein DE146DRAFT_781103 [Phaeosphaeria sp. MPI-PUGE-AT-0046c]|nr:hypothetical protein DE146DRAFT_781103 [Phaeosphaeria sp. MPI-PUGE-AT-0046c]